LTNERGGTTGAGDGLAIREEARLAPRAGEQKGTAGSGEKSASLCGNRQEQMSLYGKFERKKIIKLEWRTAKRRSYAGQARAKESTKGQAVWDGVIRWVWRN